MRRGYPTSASSPRCVMPPSTAAIAGYIRWANRYNKPKRRFTVNSEIRRPDYLSNVA
jgi:hypothetical protein